MFSSKKSLLLVFGNIQIDKSCFGVSYIFWKMRLCHFQKYIVFYGYQVVIYYMATMISPDFPIFPSMLAPLSQILNQINLIQNVIF